MTQLSPRCVDQPAQEHRKTIASLNTPPCPVRDLLRSDREETRRVGTDGHGPVFRTSAMTVRRCLELKQSRPIRAERSLQSEGHVLRQRRPAVEEIRQRRSADAQSAGSFGCCHPGRNDLLPDEAANIRGALS